MEFFKKYFDEVEGCYVREFGKNFLIAETAKENIRHSWENSLSHKRFGKDNDKTKSIVQYDLNGNIVKIWEDPNEIEKKLGIKKNSIQKSISKKYNQSFGYKWGYKEVM